MNKLPILVGAVLTSSAFAQTTSSQGAVRPTLNTLSCPKGARAVSDGEGFFCSKTGAPGGERLNGPYVGLHKNGVKESEGLYIDGERFGKWRFWNDQGVKVREIEFKNDSYDGEFVEFHADGAVKLSVTYVQGKKQGLQREFDARGKVVAQTNFVDDRAAK
ncbi:MAG: hypothetical protein INH41_22965 [Myxococcaceae bacterium]|nr:hypothetical protein [Myxococcaceae bacterium]